MTHAHPGLPSSQQQDKAFLPWACNFTIYMLWLAHSKFRSLEKVPVCEEDMWVWLRELSVEGSGSDYIRDWWENTDRQRSWYISSELKTVPFCPLSSYYLLSYPAPSVTGSSCSTGHVPTSCSPCNNSWFLLQPCPLLLPDSNRRWALTWLALQHTGRNYTGSVSFDHVNTSCHLDAIAACMKSQGARESRLPGSFRCRRPGCSRFPPSCSGTPATSVCCSSPGLGSFLRPRSAASWLPRIGRRTETGTCLIDTLKRPKTATRGGV